MHVAITTLMKLFKPFIIPLFLVFGYLALVSYPYFFSKITRFNTLGPLSVIEEKSEEIHKTGGMGEHLLKGEKITGKLFVTENNFGIVLVRFVPLSANVLDVVTFRIKEEGAEKWFYENNYNANQFQPDEYFTFGFQTIKDSKDKVYVFEVESLAGTTGNGIGLSPKKPQAAVVSKYVGEDLKNINTLFSFFSKKFVYVLNNLDILQKWQILFVSFFIYLSILFIKKRKNTFKKEKRVKLASVSGFLPPLVQGLLERFFKRPAARMKSQYLLQQKIIVRFSKKLTREFYTTQFYSLFLNTNLKKRIAIGLLLFLIAFLYRFSQASVDQLGVNSFYAGLGGQGDYDQFIRAATCAVRNFCPAILGQNFLFESSVLGTFYEIFGFIGGIKIYLYLMITISSIVATLPYVLLSRKNFFTIGGIIGALFLATSDYFTKMALALPPDNGSLFLFSIFFIVYLFTINIGSVRWLLILGLAGTIDGLNKLTMLINDLGALVLFAPVFFIDKSKKINRFPFIRFNPKLIFYSLIPLLVFIVIYCAWEYVVQIKFATPYYLRALIEGGSVYGSSTDAGSTSFNESLLKRNILEILYYYAGSFVVMLRRIIEYAGLNAVFLTPIFIGLLFVTFSKSPVDNLRARNFFIAKLIAVVIFASILFIILELFRGNFLGIQEIGIYIHAWPKSTYTNIFLFAGIIFLFILNFKHQAVKYALPIIPYVIMLVILAKNAPEARLLAHVIAWTIILFSYLFDWILTAGIRNDKKNILKRLWIGPVILIFFISFYSVPKLSIMVDKLAKGYDNSRNEVKYLKWVNSLLPANAIILAGGKSDLIVVGENIERPIIYNSLWSSALLIKPGEIPGIKAEDFTIFDKHNLNRTEIPGITPSDFSMTRELKSKDNFKKDKYLILEDDIYIWRSRIAGVQDSVFSTTSGTLLHADDYSLQIYKYNPVMNKGIYELKLKETENL